MHSCLRIYLEVGIPCIITVFRCLPNLQKKQIQVQWRRVLAVSSARSEYCLKSDARHYLQDRFQGPVSAHTCMKMSMRTPRCNGTPGNKTVLFVPYVKLPNDARDKTHKT